MPMGDLTFELAYDNVTVLVVDLENHTDSLVNDGVCIPYKHMVQGNFIVDASVTSNPWTGLTTSTCICILSGPLTVFSANTVTLYVCTTSSVTLMSIFLATPEHFLVNTLLLLILHSVLT
jgi:hypothetical protein